MNTFLRVTAIGNLGNDPEIRYTPAGVAVANISIATAHSYKKDGEWLEETEWTRCVCFGKMAERVSEYLRKGSGVYVEGRLKTNKWEDKEGNTRYNTDLVVSKIDFLTNWGRDAGAGEPSGRSIGRDQQQRREQPTVTDDGHDDIPF